VSTLPGELASVTADSRLRDATRPPILRATRGRHCIVQVERREVAQCAYSPHCEATIVTFDRLSGLQDNGHGNTD
jgi:hypothetical protein